MNTAELKALGDQVKFELNQLDVAAHAAEEKPRWHLGISIIGDECARKTWYSFRWASKQHYAGHQVRIFAFGHLIEPMLINMFSRFCRVETRDPETGKQFLYSAIHGHFGGSADGLAYDFPGLPTGKLIVEAKSHNAGSFSALIRDGVAVSKPQHFAQMSGYGHAFNAEYTAYLAFSKNDSDFHVEFVRNDFELAKDNERKAEDIIITNIPPPKISTKSTDYRCKLCDHNRVCHFAAPAQITCRSCQCSTPTYNGEWYCNKYGQNIPRNITFTGCESYEPLI